MKKITIYIFIIVVFVTASSQFSLAEDYQIEKIKGNIYRFIDNRHRSVFLVTAKGILVTDPLNTRAATWLKAEFEKRFKVPIKYVVYSHNHSDHIYAQKYLLTRIPLLSPTNLPNRIF